MKPGQLVRINKTSGTKRLLILDDKAQTVGAIMLMPNTLGIFLGDTIGGDGGWGRILTERGMGWIYFGDLVPV